MGNVVYQVQKTAGQCFSKWGPDGDIGTNGCRALPSPVLDVLALVLPLSFVLAVPTPYPQPWTYSCFSPAANVTVSLPVRGCVQDEFCTRDSATGPGFTLSGSCCQGSRCNSDLRNKTYFSPRFPPLVLLPPPRSTTLAPNKSVSTSTSDSLILVILTSLFNFLDLFFTKFVSGSHIHHPDTVYHIIARNYTVLLRISINRALTMLIRYGIDISTMYVLNY